MIERTLFISEYGIDYKIYLWKYLDYPDMNRLIKLVKLIKEDYFEYDTNLNKLGDYLLEMKQFKREDKRWKKLIDYYCEERSKYGR